MRILIVSDHYPPFIGGAHRQTQMLARELHKRGFEVNVATVWHPGFSEEEMDEGVKVHRLKQIRTLLPFNNDVGQQRHQPPFPDPVSVIELRRLIHSFKPDVVHSHGWMSFTCAAALLGMDTPLIISGRDYGYSCATRTLLYHGKPCSGPALAKCMECAAQFYNPPKGIISALSILVGKPLLKHKVKGIHSISHFVEWIIERDLYSGQDRSLENRGGPVTERIIPSFLVHDENEPTDPSVLENLPSEPFILFVGALQKRKGIEVLINAYQRLKSAPPLVLIGYPSQDMPPKYPAGVTVLMNVPHASVMAAWDRSLFGVIPSLWPEPLGGVVYEGMSRGKAVIGTTPGGQSEMIVDGKSGLLVPSGDEEALTWAMQRLIDDPELTRQLGCAAHERAKMFTPEASLPRFEELYQQVLKGERSHADEKHSLPLG